MTANPIELLTLGHSNHAIEPFLELLRRHAVAVVVDVRARPYSRFVPHFSRERLARLLAAEGIGYRYLGQELGGTPSSQQGRGAPPMPYAARIALPAFQDGIARLQEVARTQRAALVCRERDPLDCHRFHLICRYVRRLVGSIHHILPDGRVEAQAVTERRLLERAGSPQLPLLERGPEVDEQALEAAYDRWGQGIRP
jgi:uncharacterized protein (DUF488 family)